MLVSASSAANATLLQAIRGFVKHLSPTEVAQQSVTNTITLIFVTFGYS
jgi:hypothetical protein